MAKTVKAIATPDLSKRMTAELLGNAIKARRTQSNLKLADAAALCNVSKQTFSDIEHGKESFQFATMLQICDGLGIKLFIKPWPSAGEINNE